MFNDLSKFFNSPPYLVLLCFFLLFTIEASCQTNKSQETTPSTWKTYKKNDTLSVLYRKIKGKSTIEIKSSALVKSSLSGFLLFLQDYPNIPKWLDNASGSQIIQQVTLQENIFRTQFFAVWPVSPREMIIQTRFWQTDNGNLHITVQDASKNHPLHKDHIAISVIEANWHIQPLSESLIRINYQFIADANGDVPYWLANNIALSSIWQTLKNIEQQLPVSQWQQRTLNYIKEYNQLKK